MATWYSTGTVSVTNGLTGVTGTGTAFDANARVGDAFIAPDGKLYEIVNIASSTVISIAPAYLGTTASGQSYRIAPIQGYVKASADALKAFTAQNIEGGLAIASGGTGATTASDARNNLGITSIVSSITSGSTKVGDADKLDGYDSSEYVRYSQILGSFGNLSAPLTHLPLKKNLLTAHGQSICTFTRASAATYVDRYGVLKSVAADIPRFTADGLLIEGASTNLLTYSEQFDNAAWVKTGATVTANTSVVTDPYGTNLADKFVEDSSASAIHGLNQTISFTSGTVYTFSVFAKLAERSIASLVLPSAAFASSGRRAYFNLSAGTVGTVETGVTASIKPYSNGWYRISVTATANATAAGTASILAHTAVGTEVYTGDGTSGLYIFGTQLEASPFATSYIPTTTASATRAADSVGFPSAENMPSYSGDFTVIVDVKFDGNKTSNQYIFDDGTLRIFRSPTRIISCVFNSVTITGNTALADNTAGRISVVKNGTTLNIYLNGSLVGTGTVSNTSNPVTCYFGYARISSFKSYDRALTAQEEAIA